MLNISQFFDLYHYFANKGLIFSDPTRRNAITNILFSLNRHIQSILDYNHLLWMHFLSYICTLLPFHWTFAVTRPPLCHLYFTECDTLTQHWQVENKQIKGETYKERSQLLLQMPCHPVTAPGTGHLAYCLHNCTLYWCWCWAGGFCEGSGPELQSI